MSKNPLIELRKLGQSFWYDNISRELINSGELKRLIDEDGLRGVTSNPSIFYKSIKGSTVYDELFKSLSGRNDLSDKEIFYELAVRDIQDAADMLKPVYDESHGSDGFVSMEVDPSYAYNVSDTVREAGELFKRINRPNIMIKVPATKEGLISIRKLISMGININATLLFSVKRYEETTHAYLSGLEDRVRRGEPVDSIQSVASFFVSRIDTLTDKILENRIKSGKSPQESEKAKKIMGKTAVANAKIAYRVYKKVFSDERFLKLKEKGGHIQRLLWGSTSTKNPGYNDLLYVDNLIGPGTVNTMPPNTLEAFRDHGKVERTIDKDLDEAFEVLDTLDKIEVDIGMITDELEDDGVRLFREAFDSLLSLIKEKR
ncbi:transaldolase [bacterium BMS3Abin07]|nr:transaldolase [bacterium BMS3Abin07]GBE31944.1 transaldolase [bacterium BMS3Bbin05]HDL19709.1 transaldolase [Nitrospirota bacterium]HDO21679.1 transaldolase [Nitrospirota bacterium]HDZ87704.1 transaldolase [Nitrospirota bacterium]